jgi:hypothetical protein
MLKFRKLNSLFITCGRAVPGLVTTSGLAHRIFKKTVRLVQKLPTYTIFVHRLPPVLSPPSIVILTDRFTGYTTSSTGPITTTTNYINTYY